MEPMKPDCTRALQRKWPKTSPAGFSGTLLRSGFGARFAKLWRFRAILCGIHPGFSATQTEWRRGGDSNPRSPFDSCKSPISLDCRTDPGALPRTLEVKSRSQTIRFVIALHSPCKFAKPGTSMRLRRKSALNAPVTFKCDYLRFRLS